jgi:hypothetical protein
MRLKIKIDIPDDRDYREGYSPYDIREGRLAADIDSAIRDALSAMQRIDSYEINCSIKNESEHIVGRLKVRLVDVRLVDE